MENITEQGKTCDSGLARLQWLPKRENSIHTVMMEAKEGLEAVTGNEGETARVEQLL